MVSEISVKKRDFANHSKIFSNFLEFLPQKNTHPQAMRAAGVRCGNGGSNRRNVHDVL